MTNTTTQYVAMSPAEAKQRLIQQGITQIEIAKRLGVARTSVADVLNGRNKGHRGAANKIAQYLDIDIKPRKPRKRRKSKKAA